MPARTAPPTLPSFEQALGELETIVQAMENDTLPLEEALQRYQRGVELLRHCQQTLSNAEQKISRLEGEGQDSLLQPLTN